MMNLNAAPKQFASPDKDRKSTRLNSSHGYISYAVFCLKKKFLKASFKMLTVQRQDSAAMLSRQQPARPREGQPRPNDEQLELWRKYLRTHAAITRQLDAELARDHGLGLSEYEVLLFLSRAPGNQMRLIRLAEESLVTRSG